MFFYIHASISPILVNSYLAEIPALPLELLDTFGVMKKKYCRSIQLETNTYEEKNMVHLLQNFPRLLFLYSQVGNIHEYLSLGIVLDNLSIFEKSQVLTQMSPYHWQNILQHSLTLCLLSSALI